MAEIGNALIAAISIPASYQTGCQRAFAGASFGRAWRALRVLASDLVLDGDLKSELITLLPRLRRFALTLTRSNADADDLVQEACLIALNKQAQWDRAQPLDRWVFRIMRNHWISETRKRKVRMGQGQVDAHESDDLQTNVTAEHALAANQLMCQILAMPEELASVLLLVAVEGYAYQEAAELLDIPAGTIMSRLHRARKTLAAVLESTAGEPS